MFKRLTAVVIMFALATLTSCTVNPSPEASPLVPIAVEIAKMRIERAALDRCADKASPACAAKLVQVRALIAELERVQKGGVDITAEVRAAARALAVATLVKEVGFTPESAAAVVDALVAAYLPAP